MKTFSHIALTLASLLALSCAKEAQPECNDQMLTVQYGITVDAPTKALGDGKTANYVWYAVYRSNGTLMSECAAPAKIDIATGKAICPVTMVKDQNFKVVFLAMYFDEDGGNKIPVYKIDARNNTVSMPAQAEANTDKYDLFYGIDEVIDYQGTQSTNIQLDRIVAQVNFELAEASWNALGVTSSHMSEIEISGAPSKMNLLDATYSGSIDMTYSKAVIPSEGNRIGTAYCFASSDPAQAVKVNASIRLYQNESDTQPKSASASDILVSANKKTNLILGSLN